MEARAASGRAGCKWAWGVARNAGEARQSEKSGRNEAENTDGEMGEAGKYERDEAENVGGEVCTNSKICARYGTSVHDAQWGPTKTGAENGTLPDISDQFVRERGLAASCHRAEVEIIVHRPAESYTGTDMYAPHHNRTAPHHNHTATQNHVQAQLGAESACVRSSVEARLMSIITYKARQYR